MWSPRRGCWIVHIPTNQIGKVHNVTKRKALCKFGADGPWMNCWFGRLRPATIQEIQQATGR